MRSVSEKATNEGVVVALVVGDDLNAVVLPDADARVRGTKVDANRETLNLAVLAHECLLFG